MSLQVPPIIHVESGTETALPVEVTARDPVSQKAMVVIRGIPAKVSLTAGRLFPSGVWAVKATEARSLRFVTASSTQEVAYLVFSLVTLDGTYLGNVTAQLVIAPGGAADGAGPEPPGAASAAPPSARMTAAMPPDQPIGFTREEDARPPALPPVGPGRIFEPVAMDKVLKLMDRGDQHLLEGKIASARRFYQLATEMGWPDGALAIARTYDADHLRRFPILGGIEPDEILARQWYNRARELSLQPQVTERRDPGRQ